MGSKGFTANKNGVIRAQGPPGTPAVEFRVTSHDRVKVRVTADEDVELSYEEPEST